MRICHIIYVTSLEKRLRKPYAASVDVLQSIPSLQLVTRYARSRRLDPVRFIEMNIENYRNLLGH